MNFRIVYRNRNEKVFTSANENFYVIVREGFEANSILYLTKTWIETGNISDCINWTRNLY